MFKVPVTYLFAFEFTDERSRRYAMHDFACHGAKHLVLCDALFEMIFGDFRMEKKLLDEMAAEGLSFCDAHAPFGTGLDMCTPDEALRPQMLLRHRLALQICAEMGVDTITIHTGTEKAFPDYPLEVQYDAVRRSLDELLPAAEQLGITICLENIWYRLTTVDRLWGLKKLYPTDKLGFCYDSGHANVFAKGRTPDATAWRFWTPVPPEFDDQVLEKMLPEVVSCHLHDNHGFRDEHLLPGRGNVDWKHIIGLLKQAPRLACIQSEASTITQGVTPGELCAAFRELGEL